MAIHLLGWQTGLGVFLLLFAEVEDSGRVWEVGKGQLIVLGTENYYMQLMGTHEAKYSDWNSH